MAEVEARGRRLVAAACEIDAEGCGGVAQRVQLDPDLVRVERVALDRHALEPVLAEDLGAPVDQLVQLGAGVDADRARAFPAREGALGGQQPLVSRARVAAVTLPAASGRRERQDRGARGPTPHARTSTRSILSGVATPRPSFSAS